MWETYPQLRCILAQNLCNHLCEDAAGIREIEWIEKRRELAYNSTATNWQQLWHDETTLDTKNKSQTYEEGQLVSDILAGGEIDVLQLAASSAQYLFDLLIPWPAPAVRAEVTELDMRHAQPDTNRSLPPAVTHCKVWNSSVEARLDTTCLDERLKYDLPFSQTASSWRER